MSSKGVKGSKDVDKGDGHWSGVGKGGNLTVTFTNTDIVKSLFENPGRTLTSVCPKKNENSPHDCDFKH